MHGHEGGLAIGSVLFLAGSGDFAICGTSNSDYGVPDANITWCASAIDLNNDGTWKDFRDGKAHLRYFYNAFVICISNLYDWDWVGRVLEIISGPCGVLTWAEESRPIQDNVPEMTGHASPTIREPGGMNKVSRTMYTPYGK